MTVRLSRRIALIGILAASAVTGSQAAHGPRVLHLSGVIADATVPSAGAWVIRGTWSLDAYLGPNDECTQADFTASLTMERSDYYLVANPSANPELPSTRNAHTHHVLLHRGTVSPITGGFELTGPASVTLNGAAPPFGLSSPIVVDITGDGVVRFSNLKLSFGGGALSHFGSLPIAGVVRAGQHGDRHDSDDGRHHDR